jgi:hypothetical protein
MQSGQQVLQSDQKKMEEVQRVREAITRGESVLTDCQVGFIRHHAAELPLRSNIPFKVAELRLRRFFLQVVELRLQTLKKVACAYLNGIVQRILRGVKPKLK